MSRDNWIERITDKRKTETDSHTYLIIFFGKVCQNDSLYCEKGLSTYTKCCPDNIDDPFVSGNHELEDDSWEKHGSEAEKAKEEESFFEWVLINEKADWDLKDNDR